MIKQFAIIHSNTIIPNTCAESSSDSILRFFNVDGMGKYIELGWKRAVEDGYFIGVVKIDHVL